jgi:LysR family transcriptional regulator, low CO2-responsive transcriptional regulator
MTDMRGLTLKHLRANETAARLKSFSDAARALKVSPPAITAQIKSLEALIGTDLFDRSDGLLKSTPAGQVLVDVAADINRLLEHARARLKALQQGAAGVVVFAAVSTAKYIVPEIVSRFEAENPGIRVRLVIGNRREILRGLQANEYEILLTGRPPMHVPIESEYLCDHLHIVIASPTSQIALRRRLKPSDIVGQRILSRELGSGTRLVMENFLAKVAAEHEFDITEMDSNETIKQAVMAGLGIAVISAHTCLAELEFKRLVALPLQGFPIVRQWYLINRSDRSLSPAAKTLKRFVVDRREALFPQPNLGNL